MVSGDSDADRGFAPYPSPTRSDGKPRRVGVEIELGGLTVDETAEVAQSTLGGSVEIVGPHQVKLVESAIGKLKIELDSRFMKREKHRELLDWLGLERDPEGLSDAIDRVVVRVASQFIPCEIVTEPLERKQLVELERLREALRVAGAEGTGVEPWYAFGIHFNPEVPSTGARSLHAHLQAFCLLEDWLRELERLDLTRRMSPFIDPFPASYRELVLRGPRPKDRARLVEDYLRHNPTRNRGLDMLPLFAELEPDLVLRYVDDELVKPRPTFHYRLGNCRIDDPVWRLADEWAAWIEVERLAADDARREHYIERGETARGDHP